MNEDDRTWAGVLIFEVDAKFISTAAQPRSTDADAEGARLLTVIEAALKADAEGRQFEVGGVRYAGARGSTRYT
jgi:hypothetical protein